jgi:hypothetical protein
MTDKTSEFLSEIQRKVAASDAQANSDLADIMAGRPYKRRVVKAEAATGDAPAPEKKPRAKRAPRKRPAASSED